MFIFRKAGNGGGVVITFNEEITFSSVIIGARKSTESWNHGRYQGVKVLVDGQEVAKTSSSFRVPDDYIIPIIIPCVKGTSLELKWPSVPVQIATLEVLYIKDKAPPPTPILDMEIYFEENMYMKSNVKEGKQHLLEVGSPIECTRIPPGSSFILNES